MNTLDGSFLSNRALHYQIKLNDKFVFRTVLHFTASFNVHDIFRSFESTPSGTDDADFHESQR